MRKVSKEALARQPPVYKDYADANGYVFLDVPVEEAEPGWVELTREQRDSVRPLSKVDAKQWDAWHAKKGRGLVPLCRACCDANGGEQTCVGMITPRACEECGQPATTLVKGAS